MRHFWSNRRISTDNFICCFHFGAATISRERSFPVGVRVDDHHFGEDAVGVRRLHRRHVEHDRRHGARHRRHRSRRRWGPVVPERVQRVQLLKNKFPFVVKSIILLGTRSGDLSSAVLILGPLNQACLLSIRSENSDAPF